MITITAENKSDVMVAGLSHTIKKTVGLPTRPKGQDKAEVELQIVFDGKLIEAMVEGAAWYVAKNHYNNNRPDAGEDAKGNRRLSDAELELRESYWERVASEKPFKIDAATILAETKSRAKAKKMTIADYIIIYKDPNASDEQKAFALNKIAEIKNEARRQAEEADKALLDIEKKLKK